MNDLKRFLEEDVGSGDVTVRTFIPDHDGTAVIICEEDAVVSGLEEAKGIFSLMGTEAIPLIQDGDRVPGGTDVMKLAGPMGSMLTCERTALNFLMRMSGISTATAHIVDMVRTEDPHMKIAGTRKTTPGFRQYEKKAIALGGGWPHRMGLYDMSMVKDNHIVACGGLKNILEKAGKLPKGIPLEVEVTDFDEGIAAAESGVGIIMADHFTPADTKRLREAVRNINPEILIEASGNITSENVFDYVGCADIVSLGSLTHSARSVHFSMDLETTKN